jgi:hypothetical protein
LYPLNWASTIRGEVHPGGPGDWSERDWEENWEQSKRHARTFLAREFATPNWRAISAETVGLAEITYPGLDGIEAPAKFIGDLPNEKARQEVRGCWSALLHAFCDTLRVAGVITLGDKQANIAFQSGRVPVGQWSAKHEDGSSPAKDAGADRRQRSLRDGGRKPLALSRGSAKSA